MKILLAVAACFVLAAAVWAGEGECLYHDGATADEAILILPGVDAIVSTNAITPPAEVTVSTLDATSILVRWNRVDAANAYRIYREKTVGLEASADVPGDIVVVEDERSIEMMPWTRVEATPEVEVLEALVEPRDRLETRWGVQALGETEGIELQSPVVLAIPMPVPTGVENESWGQVKAATP